MTRALVAAAAAAAAGMCVFTGPSAQAADPRGVLTAFLKTVSIRHGVAYGSLAVLPIVLDEDGNVPAPAPGAADAAAAGGLSAAGAAGIQWHPVPGSEFTVEFAAGPAPPGRERFLPTGTLLVGGERERLLGRPVPLRGDEKCSAGSLVCDGRAKPATPDAAPRPGPIAPIEQRKLALRGEGDGVMTFVQKIQCALANLPPATETVAEVLESKFVTEGREKRWTELSRVPRSYGGRAVGHVVFFGYRPVEVIAYARAADYQALGPLHLRAVAASHTYWSETVGNGARAVTDADVRTLAAEGLAALQSFTRMPTRTVRGREGERCRWTLHAGEADTDLRAAGGKDSFTCRFTLDDGGRFMHLEAIENSAEPIFPPPYREPGGRPVGDPPSNKGNGPMGPEAMRRYLERIMEHRAKRAATGN